MPPTSPLRTGHVSAVGLTPPQAGLSSKLLSHPSSRSMLVPRRRSPIPENSTTVPAGGVVAGTAAVGADVGTWVVGVVAAVAGALVAAVVSTVGTDWPAIRSPSEPPRVAANTSITSTMAAATASQGTSDVPFRRGSIASSPSSACSVSASAAARPATWRSARRTISSVVVMAAPPSG